MIGDVPDTADGECEINGAPGTFYWDDGNMSPVLITTAALDALEQRGAVFKTQPCDRTVEYANGATAPIRRTTRLRLTILDSTHAGCDIIVDNVHCDIVTGTTCEINLGRPIITMLGMQSIPQQ